ncbi:alanine dehydrogenase [Bacterioplanoides sp. SCSIO 12839]|uniref:alanine dehydrogenase n=1 Tax=Bacterioplanoides sp. SCSIO 12839 TaxID=2829569 RepID=UPI00210316FC|nr:alanine dehydrogenase [Bacterioplanoides sp. SCSIO 12839]UTW46856.1 alanine dehydrogenase [Bacterioplanoides sp. SCSIO 12839]
MRIGVPKESKNHEYRVGLTPASVRELVQFGHEVLVEQHAGKAIGFSDEDYQASGADVVATKSQVFAQSELIIKVKEPQPDEVHLFHDHHTLFTYLHLAPDPQLTQALLKTGATCIAYETVTDNAGRLPLLAPMSEIAGRIAVQAGARSLEMEAGGRGVLLSGAPGVPAGNVIVLGGGVVGRNAVAIAVGMGAHVTVLDTSLVTLRELDLLWGNRIHTLASTQTTLDSLLPSADLVIGAVLIPGARAPKLVTRNHLESMKAGAVVVDVAIDQGGCVETARPTTHSQPTFIEQGVVHYCVANMPGAVARTSTLALNNATLPFVLALANQGIVAALRNDPYLLQGLNIWQGQLTSPEVAASQNVPYANRQDLIH